MPYMDKILQDKKDLVPLFSDGIVLIYEINFPFFIKAL